MTLPGKPPKHNYSTPTLKLQIALTSLSDKKAQWENLIEAINNVKEVSNNHPEILASKLNEATGLGTGLRKFGPKIIVSDLGSKIILQNSGVIFIAFHLYRICFITN